MSPFYYKIYITISKNVLKFFILLIHFSTRTPLIIIYYGAACYGLFGAPGELTSYCFYSCILLLLINIFLIILFNNEKSKKKSIELVGEVYYEKYMTHSSAGGKSLYRLGSGLFYPCIVEVVTSAHAHYNFTTTTDKLRADLQEHRNWADNAEARRMIKKTKRVLNETISKHVDGGLISTALRNERTIEGYHAASSAVSSSVNAIWGKVTGREK